MRLALTLNTLLLLFQLAYAQRTGCGAGPDGSDIYDQKSCGQYLADPSGVYTYEGGRPYSCKSSHIIRHCGELLERGREGSPSKYCLASDLVPGSGSNVDRCFILPDHVWLDLRGHTIHGRVTTDVRGDPTGIHILDGAIECNFAGSGAAVTVGCVGIGDSSARGFGSPDNALVLHHLSIRNTYPSLVKSQIVESNIPVRFESHRSDTAAVTRLDGKTWASQGWGPGEQMFMRDKGPFTGQTFRIVSTDGTTAMLFNEYDQIPKPGSYQLTTVTTAADYRVVHIQTCIAPNCHSVPAAKDYAIVLDHVTIDSAADYRSYRAYALSISGSNLNSHIVNSWIKESGHDTAWQGIAFPSGQYGSLVEHNRVTMHPFLPGDNNDGRGILFDGFFINDKGEARNNYVESANNRAVRVRVCYAGGDKAHCIDQPHRILIHDNRFVNARKAGNSVDFGTVMFGAADIMADNVTGSLVSHNYFDIEQDGTNATFLEDAFGVTFAQNTFVCSVGCKPGTYVARLTTYKSGITGITTSATYSNNTIKGIISPQLTVSAWLPQPHTAITAEYSGDVEWDPFVAKYPEVRLSYGTIKTGDRSAAQQVILLNSTQQHVEIHNILVTGGDASQFELQSHCGEALNPGQRCAVAVTFVPNKPGHYESLVHIEDTGTATPHSFTVSGTAR